MVRKKKLMVIAESANPHGVVVPKNFVAYFMMIKMHPTKNGERSNLDIVKNAVLKRLLSICELLAQL